MSNTKNLANQLQKDYIEGIHEIKELIEDLEQYAAFISDDDTKRNQEACKTDFDCFYSKYFGKEVWVLYGAAGMARGTIIGKRPTENGGVLVEVQYRDPVSNEFIRAKRVCIIGYDAFESLVDAEYEASRRLKKFISDTSVFEEGTLI